MTEELLNRINELARKKRAEGLTLEEQQEQQALYKVYLGDIRKQVDISLQGAGYEPTKREKN
ncbi:MAG: DUF896 domain-containing protein [Bacillota bacterium]|nr:DUF896 domain-containing protein [Bacillota bacterium]